MRKEPPHGEIPSAVGQAAVDQLLGNSATAGWLAQLASMQVDASGIASAPVGGATTDPAAACCRCSGGVE